MQMKLSDWHLVILYRYWSEETYCAGFIGADEDTVKRFREWLRDESLDPLCDYELEMINIFKRQEEDA